MFLNADVFASFLHGVLAYTRGRVNELEEEANSVRKVYQELQELYAKQKQQQQLTGSSSTASQGSLEDTAKIMQKVLTDILELERLADQMQRYSLAFEKKVAAHEKASKDRGHWEDLHAAKSDVYGLGCVFLELLTHGELPFEPLLRKNPSLSVDEPCLMYLLAYVSDEPADQVKKHLAGL